MTAKDDKGTYLYFPLDVAEATAEQAYVKRYGQKPDVCRRWVINHWPGEEPWGYTIAGPIPEKDGEG